MVQPAVAAQRELTVGQEAFFAGQVTNFRGVRQLAQPSYQLTDAEGAEDFASGLTPIYPATGRLQSWQVAKAVRIALDVLDEPDDPLPAELRIRHGLPTLAEALRLIHRPSSRPDVVRGRTRLTWDEALTLQVVLAQRRRRALERPATPRPLRADGLRAAFDAQLPFTLTEGQRRVSAELTDELAGARPMYRLLAGEVGSGKTVVALQAMLSVVDAGGQAALLAPTEVLAAQHARSLSALLGPLASAGRLWSDGAGTGDAPAVPARDATTLALLTGQLTTSARREALAAIADGTAGIVVGTHALLSEGVRFADLGLVVVDEQHRFGVDQRDALRGRGGRSGTEPPHVLVMTATPIPRTVAMTVYGDLETSILSELPPGRQPITTHLVDRAQWVDRVWARVAEEVAAGRRAYVVCPRIGDEAVPSPESGSDADAGPGADGGSPASDALFELAGSQPDRPPLAVLDVLPELQERLPGARIAVLHGRLPVTEKDDAAMQAFATGQVDVLLATTVIEVGVDVPEATVMVVLDANRFGISQLHQLRGRIGRGERARHLSARHRDRARERHPPAAPGGGHHVRRLRTGPRGSADAPRRRRARRGPARPATAPAPARSAPARGPGPPSPGSGG